jgi:hypothetical protein
VRIVGLVARIAEHAPGVFGRDHLREARWFGRILLMTAPAQVGDIGQLRHVGHWVVRMFREGAMAGFAGDVRVLSHRARLSLIVVAEHARVLPGKSHGTRPDGIECGWAVVPVLAKPFGNDKGTDEQENAKDGRQNDRWPDQMS